MGTQIVWRGYNSNWFSSFNWVQPLTGLGGPPTPGMDVLINSSYGDVTPVVNGVLYNLNIEVAPYQLTAKYALSGQSLVLSSTQIDLNPIHSFGLLHFDLLTVGAGSRIHTEDSVSASGLEGSTLVNQGTISAGNGLLFVSYAAVTNQNVIQAAGSGAVVMRGTSLNNASVISASDGGDITLTFQNIMGKGAFFIDTGGQIDVSGNVASSVSVVFGLFASSAGTLELGTPNSFAANILGFNSSDVLQLDYQHVTSAAWSNNHLSVFGSGGLLETLNLHGSYSGSHFNTTYDAATQHSLISMY